MNPSPLNHPSRETHSPPPEPAPPLPLVKLIAEILARAERSRPGTDKVA